ncbi:MAG: carboxylating nicotinate-nucleotide diphosphorylase [Phycisphaerae bacterium]|nr:carboxylating nicotinate-nucleotide diphosphorylase [Phycisphaerae bacterium]
MKLDPPAPSTFIDLLKRALAEDIGPGDITSQALVDENLLATAVILAKQEGVLAGLFLLQPLADLLDPQLNVQLTAADAQSVQPEQEIVRISGSCRGLLALERVALNFLAHLSGIATLTGKFVQAVQNTRAIICDTRKTTPGLRSLEKYAVRAGGGSNHRLGLFDSAMIKDNHLSCLGSDPRLGDCFAALGKRLPELRSQLPPGGFIQLEVDDLPQFQRVLDLHLDLDMVLLDNFSEPDLAQAVKLRNQAGLAGKLLLEASGNITLENVNRVARSGIDRISVGALTHSAPAFDFSMEFIQK